MIAINIHNSSYHHVSHHLDVLLLRKPSPLAMRAASQRPHGLSEAAVPLPPLPRLFVQALAQNVVSFSREDG